MSKENVEKKMDQCCHVNDNEPVTIKSLIAQAKGIEPLIIGIFIIIAYWFISAIAYFLSWKFGRL